MSVGRGCASRLSVRFWRRRRRRARCARRCSNWRRANGVTRAPARRSASASPHWSDGSTEARNEQHDPVSVLRRKRRGDAGEQTSMTPSLRQALLAQYNAHKSWSAQSPSRQSGSLGRDPRGAAAGAVLRDGSAIPGRTRPDQTATDDDASDRRRAGGRGAARGT